MRDMVRVEARVILDDMTAHIAQFLASRHEAVERAVGQALATVDLDALIAHEVHRAVEDTLAQLLMVSVGSAMRAAWEKRIEQAVQRVLTPPKRTPR